MNTTIEDKIKNYNGLPHMGLTWIPKQEVLRIIKKAKSELIECIKFNFNEFAIPEMPTNLACEYVEYVFGKLEEAD